MDASTFDYRSSHIAVYTLVCRSLHDKQCVEVAELRRLAASERMDLLLLGWQLAHIGLNLVRDGDRMFLVEPVERTLDEKLRWLGLPDQRADLARLHDFLRDHPGASNGAKP